MSRHELEADASQPQRERVAQLLSCDLVVALPSDRCDRHDSGIEEDAQVARRGRP